MKNQHSSRWITVSVILWGFCVSAVIIALAWYDVRGFSFTPTINRAPELLPSPTYLRTESLTKPIVAMFVHPRCPCSRASLTEFTGVMQEFENHAVFRLIFFKPASQNLAWVQRDNLFARALDIPNLTVSIDEDGKEAEHFHAETSGFVVAYTANGNLLFSGGITASRGHEGDNAGKAALKSALFHALQGEKLVQSAFAPTFGCSILSNSTNTVSAQ